MAGILLRLRRIPERWAPVCAIVEAGRSVRLHQAGRWCVFAAYLLALVFPNVSIFWIYSDRANAAKLFLSVLFVVVWHLAFKRPSRAVACMLPAFLILPLFLLFILTYHEPPTTNVIAILADTNLREAGDFASGQVNSAAGAVIASLTIWFLALRLSGSSWRGIIDPRARDAAG